MTGLAALAQVIPQEDFITCWGVTREQIEEQLRKRFSLEMEPERLTTLLDYLVRARLVTCEDGRYLQVKR